MDLYVERQCIEQMKEGNLKQFLMLFDANFDDLYKYVQRRVSNKVETERIVSLTFLDALGQIQSTPLDSGYVIWLYGLAKTRVWNYLSKNGFPKSHDFVAESEGDAVMVKEAEKMISKLLLEEREILRLKFFEEVTDGDVMAVLGVQDGAIGPKIYRVLKRVHFLLFGESDERQGVYFGEVSAFLAKIRSLEVIAAPEAYRLTLRADLDGRIERKDLAIEAEVIEEVKIDPNAKGSNDPAKIFVEAVKEMREEERKEQEKREKTVEFFDRFRFAFLAVPALVFILVVFYVVNTLIGLQGTGNRPLERGYVTGCNFEVEFEGEFADGERRSVSAGITDRLCDYFEIERLLLVKESPEKVLVEVDLKDWFLDYVFVKKSAGWRIKEYERAYNWDGERGEV